MLDGPQVHWLEDDLVVVGIVLLRGLDHEEVAQPAAAPGFSRLGHRSKKDLHSVLLCVLLVAGNETRGRNKCGEVLRLLKERRAVAQMHGPFSFYAVGVGRGRGHHAVSVVVVPLQKLLSLHLNGEQGTAAFQCAWLIVN